MRPTHDGYFTAMAMLVASRSTCLRRAVGCVMVNARYHVLSTGYNGRPAGWPHCNDPTGFEFVYDNGIDDAKPITGQATGKRDVFDDACIGARAPSGQHLDMCEAVHAEQNALLQCRDVFDIDTCYVTTSPCITCVKLLLNTACQRIVFSTRYAHDAEARRLWELPGRVWQLHP